MFAGVGVALVTLFRRDGTLDSNATARLAAEITARGATSVLVAGTTGEGATLEFNEREILIRSVREAVADTGASVVVGVDHPDSRIVCELTKQAVEMGAHCILGPSCAINANVEPLYHEVAKAAGSIPLLAYHTASSSPGALPLDQLSRLPVAGVKDSSADAKRLLTTLRTWDKPCYVGTSALLLLAGCVGAQGALVGIANLHVELCVRAFSGDGDSQLALSRHSDAGDGQTAVIKAQLAKQWGTSPLMR